MLQTVVGVSITTATADIEDTPESILASAGLPP
jgi:hypothetical protein